MRTPANITALIEGHFNRRDLDALVALWHEDIRFEGPATSFTGRVGMVAQERNLWTAFPDLTSEVSVFATDDLHAALTTRFRGTHDGPLRVGGETTLPATGRSLDFTFAALITVHDGLMVEERVFYDTADFFRQLGAVSG